MFAGIKIKQDKPSQAATLALPSSPAPPPAPAPAASDPARGGQRTNVTPCSTHQEVGWLAWVPPCIRVPRPIARAGGRSTQARPQQLLTSCSEMTWGSPAWAGAPILQVCQLSPTSGSMWAQGRGTDTVFPRLHPHVLAGRWCPGYSITKAPERRLRGCRQSLPLVLTELRDAWTQAPSGSPQS